MFEKRTSSQHGFFFDSQNSIIFSCRLRVCSEYKLNIFFLLPFDEAFTNSFRDVELANELPFTIKSLIYIFIMFLFVLGKFTAINEKKSGF